jgi:hypothetical protein
MGRGCTKVRDCKRLAAGPSPSRAAAPELACRRPPVQPLPLPPLLPLLHPPPPGPPQYFAFYSSGGPPNPSGAPVDGCYVRAVGGAIPPLTGAAAPAGGWDAPASPLVAFEVREGLYAVYPAAPGEVVGTALAGGGPRSLDAAKAACDASAECVGIHGTSNGWALFGAAKREGVVGKVRVVGENLQPWVPLPAAV